MVTLTFLPYCLLAGSGVWAFRMRRRYQLLKVATDALLGMYREKVERLRQEQQESTRWNNELFAQIMEYQAMISHKNQTINEQEQASAQLKAELAAARTLHLN